MCTALISEKERLYYFYVICNLNKKQICKILQIGERTLTKKLAIYKIKKPKILSVFNKARGMYLKYGVTNCMYLNITKEKIQKTSFKKYGCKYPNQSEKVKSKIQQSIIKHYGTNTYFESKDYKEKQKVFLNSHNVINVGQIPEVKEKIKQTNINNFGVSNVWQSEIIKKKMSQTKLEKYGNANYNNREKAEKTCLERYEVTNPAKLFETIDKMLKTKKEKGTINSSSHEIKIEKLLREKFKDVRSQYKSKEYPFACDFYIGDLDLYLEYQGYWTHGKCFSKILGPFDENNEEHLKIIQTCKEKSLTNSSYSSFIYVWTINDPKKRKIARDNNLNYLEIWNMKEFMNWYNNV